MNPIIPMLLIVKIMTDRRPSTAPTLNRFLGPTFCLHPLFASLLLQQIYGQHAPIRYRAHLRLLSYPVKTLLTSLDGTQLTYLVKMLKAYLVEILLTYHIETLPTDVSETLPTYLVEIQSTCLTEMLPTCLVEIPPAYLEEMFPTYLA